MYNANFRGCKEIAIMVDLFIHEGWVETGIDQWGYSTGKNVIKLKNTAKEIAKCIFKAKKKGKKLLLAVTNYGQETFEEFLTKFGFKVLMKFINSRHGDDNELIMWELNLTKINSTKSKKIVNSFPESEDEDE